MALPVVVRGKCAEEIPETNSNAMGVVNSKLAQCSLLEKQDKNPHTFPCLLVTFSILPQTPPPDFLLSPHLYHTT